METIAVLTGLAGMIVVAAALVCLIKPIAKLAMRTRARALLGVALGFAIFVVGGLMMPVEVSDPTSLRMPQADDSVPLLHIPGVSETALRNAEFLEPRGLLLNDLIRDEHGTDRNAQPGPGIGVTREEIAGFVERTQPDLIELQWGDADEHVMAEGGNPLEVYAFDYGGRLQFHWLRIAAQPNGDWSRDASLVYMAITLLPDQDEQNVRAVKTMGELISAVIPEWPESIDWLHNAIASDNANAQTTQYGRQIRYRNNLRAVSMLELLIEEA